MAESKKGHVHKEIDSNNKHDKDHKHLHKEDCGHKFEKHDDH
jgi:hypothetical protein